MQMEGVRLTVNKGLSNHFQVSPVCSLMELNFSGVMLLKKVCQSLVVAINSCFNS